MKKIAIIIFICMIMACAHKPGPAESIGWAIDGTLEILTGGWYCPIFYSIGRDIDDEHNKTTSSIDGKGDNEKDTGSTGQ